MSNALPFEMNVEAYNGLNHADSLVTRIDYSYVDGANWKKHATAYLPGAIEPDLFVRLGPVLFDGEFIIAEQLGLESLTPTGDEYDDEIDHVLHDINLVTWEVAGDSTPISVKAEDFIQRVEAVIATAEWDFGRYA